MLVAGEASGDQLAAELVLALREDIANRPVPPTADLQPLETSLEPRFFGAGGPRMAAAGVELAFDLTAHSVMGLDMLKHLLTFRRLLGRLVRLAIERKPDVIICVDFQLFNRLFSQEIKKYVRSHQGWFQDWQPKVVQYVSPQVWASRESRVRQMERDRDLLLSTIPFEKEWYAERAPKLRVVFVGNPVVDRLSAECGMRNAASGKGTPMVLLLPGSRVGELARHLPVMLGAVSIMQREIPGLRTRMVVANEAQRAKIGGLPQNLQVQVGGLYEALRSADVAISKTGTIATECACFGVPTVAIYKTSWATYQIAKRIVKVKYLALPNLLAEEPVFPELLQNEATPENISRAALELLRNQELRATTKRRLAEVVRRLGEPGVGRRAARAILGME
jgi:lipid-A-disaccharide synthase